MDRSWIAEHSGEELGSSIIKLLRKFGFSERMARAASPEPEKKELLASPFKIGVPRDGAHEPVQAAEQKATSFVFLPRDQQGRKAARTLSKAVEYAPQTRLAIFPHVRPPLVLSSSRITLWRRSVA